MDISVEEIYELEKVLIAEYFPGLRPRAIEIVDGCSFDGAARKHLLINKEFLAKCTKEELIDLLKHELIHYKLPGKGHDNNFMEESERVGNPITDYETNRLYEELRVIGMIEEKIEEDGKVSIDLCKKPRWELFESGYVMNSTNHGYCFRMLRQYLGLSQQEVASRAGISVYMLRKIEGTRNLYDSKYNQYDDDDKSFLEKVFDAIVSD
jgi:DNA-binding XRE family transcriptional regulator